MGRFEETFPALARLRPVDRAIAVWGFLHIGFIGDWNGYFELLLPESASNTGTLLFLVQIALVVSSVVLIFFRRANTKFRGYILCCLALLLETFVFFPFGYAFFVFGGSAYLFVAALIIIPLLHFSLLIWVVYSIFVLSKRLDRGDTA